MEEILLPKSFSCSTTSSEEEGGESRRPTEVAISILPKPPAEESKRCEYTAEWSAITLTLLIIAVCIALIIWYIVASL
jgi:hypothetical protein